MAIPLDNFEAALTLDSRKNCEALIAARDLTVALPCTWICRSSGRIRNRMGPPLLALEELGTEILSFTRSFSFQNPRESLCCQVVSTRTEVAHLTQEAFCKLIDV